MVTRRKLILSGAAGLLAATLPRAALAAPDDPVGIVTAIYTRAAKGKGDGGGGFVIENKAAKAKYLSKSLIALWAKADARTRKGDSGPVGFRSRHQFAGSRREVVQGGCREAGSRQGDRRRHDRKSSARGPRQRGRQDHPLRLCPGGRRNGRSTTSREPSTAARGRFAPCSPLHSSTRVKSSPPVTEVPASPSRNYCGWLASSWSLKRQSCQS